MLSQQNYVIVTDVTADFPVDLAQKLNIDIIPMEFMIDGVSYHHYYDAREMSMKEFYQLEKQGKMPTTTQINQETYRR